MSVKWTAYTPTFYGVDLENLSFLEPSRLSHDLQRDLSISSWDALPFAILVNGCDVLSNLFVLNAWVMKRCGTFEDKTSDRAENTKAPFVNTLRPRQNGRHLPDDIFKCIFWMKMFQFRLRFPWSLFLRVQLTIFHIGSDNGLVPTKRQAII